jgi:hypothetical protein
MLMHHTIILFFALYYLLSSTSSFTKINLEHKLEANKNKNKIHHDSYVSLKSELI